MGAIVCLIDTDGKGNKTNDNIESSEKNLETDKGINEATSIPNNYAAQTPSPAAKKIIDERGINSSDIKVLEEE